MTDVKTRNDGAYIYQADDALAAKILRADHLSQKYLADYNARVEAGKDDDIAARLYAKGQYWLDRYNKLVGNA